MGGRHLPTGTEAVTDGQSSTTHAREVAAATVEALARALELHDYRRGRFGETAAHTARVTRLAMLLAGQIAPELTLDPQLAYGFRLHDIGMIGISNSTLMKTGPLSPAEIDEIREHPWLGERIVAPVPLLGGTHPPGDRLPSRALERLGLPARACAGSRFRSPPASSRSSTRSTRSRTSSHTATRSQPRRLATRFTRRLGSTSTRTWSRRFWRSSCPPCRADTSSKTERH